jgi:ESF2/ABP1 family protein
MHGHDSSDEEDHDEGYDSEAAEVTKSSRTQAVQRPTKRRKLSHSASEEDLSESDAEPTKPDHEIGNSSAGQVAFTADGSKSRIANRASSGTQLVENEQEKPSDIQQPARKQKRRKESRPGVIYLSSIPPHLRPSALHNLLEQRGFSPVTRLFLTPIAKDAAKRTGSTSKARRSYGEGWVEFASHKTAKLCAQTLNATAIGGKKGGYYRDDLWNMKYLKGMGWNELMEGVRGERREEEARRDEERRHIQREAKIFLEGVEQGKKVEGIREKRKQKGQPDADQPKRTFRQFETQKSKSKDARNVDHEAQEVLSKIF